AQLLEVLEGPLLVELHLDNFAVVAGGELGLLGRLGLGQPPDPGRAARRDHHRAGHVPEHLRHGEAPCRRFSEASLIGFSLLGPSYRPARVAAARGGHSGADCKSCPSRSRPARAYTPPSNPQTPATAGDPLGNGLCQLRPVLRPVRCWPTGARPRPPLTERGAGFG